MNDFDPYAFRRRPAPRPGAGRFDVRRPPLQQVRRPSTNRFGMEIGKRYAVTVEGIATGEGFRSDTSGVVIYPTALDTLKTSAERLPDPAPQWLPGDVVVVRWTPRGIAYTYVRGLRGWPGENARAKTDAEISALYAEGKAQPVLQAGGVPFDPSRRP